MATINGTPDIDTLNGTDGDDVIDGLGGNDRIEGGAGDDIIDGGDGDDHITDNGGSDTIRGGNGNDLIEIIRSYSYDRRNLDISGGTGNDRVRLDAPSDGRTRVDLGAGNDRLTLVAVASSDVSLTLGAGRDTVVFEGIGIQLGFVHITDFATGNSGDAIDLVAFLAARSPNSWTTGENPFADGHFWLVQRGQDTVMVFDSFGSEGQHGSDDFIIFDNTSAAAFTAANFSGFAPRIVQEVPVPTLATVPGTRPATSVGAPVAANDRFTIGQGVVVYKDNDYINITGVKEFVNNGSIWTYYHESANGYGDKFILGSHSLDSIVNTGSIVVETRGEHNGQIGLSIFTTALDYFENSGSITLFDNSIGPGVNAVLLNSYNGKIEVKNSGNISIWSATGLALGVDFVNGGHFVNQAGGRLVVEGVRAIGARSGFGDQPYAIENYGHIEARTIGDGASVGVWLEAEQAINHAGGTITADIAVYGSGTFVNAGVVNGAIVSYDAFNLENRAGGIINGNVALGDIEDTVVNQGRINGRVSLGNSVDTFDNRGGFVTGAIDMGLGNDVFQGGAGQDLVAGDSGDDVISGNGGQDLLLGGSGNDRIEGGVGNDGLYGEVGNDILLLQGGDFASGGAGDDRFVSSDMSFQRINGGSGNDVWVLPAGGRTIDLAQVAASGRVTGIEAIELAGGQRLILGAADIAALTSETNEFRVILTATDRLDLVGAWTEGSDVTVSGVTYDRYTLGTMTLLVAGGGTTTTMATAPGGGSGLDPVAAGPAAPVPGAAIGLDLTPNELQVTALEIRESTVIDASEIWYTVGSAPAVYSQVDGATLTVNGELRAINEVAATAIGVDFFNLSHVVVNGAITAYSEGPTVNPSYFYSTREGANAIRDAVFVTNTGLIGAYAASGTASAIGLISYLTDPTEPDVFTLQVGVSRVENDGEILATAESGYAFGIASTGELFNGANGVISVAGWQYAAAAIVEGNIVRNDGLIESVILSGGPGKAVGLVLLTTVPGDEHLVVNSGTIRAATAIQVVESQMNGVFAPVRLNLSNSGMIEGNILASATNDRIMNSGAITGDVHLGSGADLFDGRLGTVEGTVFGEQGSDELIGGAGNDILDGGVGNDRMTGGRGNDYYYVDSASDLIFENAGEGNDSVATSIGHYLHANVENLTLISNAGNIFGVGNALANTLQGNAGSNLLLGGGGDDVIRGGGGVDSLFGEAGVDQLFGDAGIDYLVGGLGNDILDGGADADALYGEDGDDTLIGGAGFFTDILVGGAGNDILRGNSGLGDYDLMDGGAGNDIYYVDTPDDLTFEAVSGGADTVYANINGAGYYLYANVENLVLEGNTPFGVGNDIANRLTGNAIGNYLLGGRGNDILNGKAGNDVLFGEGGADTFIFERGTGGDVIGDFARGTDKIDLSAFGFASFAALQAGFSQVGANGAINLGNGDFIVLHNVTMSQLTQGDFVLSAMAAKFESFDDLSKAGAAGAMGTDGSISAYHWIPDDWMHQYHTGHHLGML